MDCRDALGNDERGKSHSLSPHQQPHCHHPEPSPSVIPSNATSRHPGPCARDLVRLRSSHALILRSRRRRRLKGRGHEPQTRAFCTYPRSRTLPLHCPYRATANRVSVVQGPCGAGGFCGGWGHDLPGPQSATMSCCHPFKTWGLTRCRFGCWFRFLGAKGRGRTSTQGLKRHGEKVCRRTGPLG